MRGCPVLRGRSSFLDIPRSIKRTASAVPIRWTDRLQSALEKLFTTRAQHNRATDEIRHPYQSLLSPQHHSGLPYFFEELVKSACPTTLVHQKLHSETLSRFSGEQFVELPESFASKQSKSQTTS